MDPTPAPAPKPPPEFVAEPDQDGLKIVITDADPAAGLPGDTAPVAPAKPLSADETSALLDRIPDLEMQHGDRQTFALREGSLPPPRTGATVEVAFPPKPEGPAPDPGENAPLQIVRYAPEGDVPVAPRLSVTFNHPMVAVTSQEEAAKTRPVTIEPMPEGQWRWIGTKTVLFEPDPRFDMSTDYTVKVPTGTASAIGGSLDESVEWTFSTPTMQLVNYWPSSGPTELEPLVFFEMNQRIGQEVWDKLRLEGDGEAVEITRVTVDDLKEEPAVQRMLDNATEDRWIAFRPAQPLKKATTYSVIIPEGTHGAEGPKPTPHDLRFSFTTYHPLKYEEHRCSWGTELCPPHAQWWVRFNNPLDPKVFDPKSIAVEPEVEAGLSFQANGRYLYISGHKPGSRTYEVTVPAGLTDIFGQTLGEEREVSFKVGKDDPRLTGAHAPMVVLDPDAPPNLSVYSTNHDKLKLRVYRVKPEHWAAMSKWWVDHNNDWYHSAELPGERIANKVIGVGGDVDAMVETAIDLQPYVEGEHDQLLVWVTPTRAPEEAWRRQEVIHWVQVTDLGLTAMIDQDEIYAWANELRDGKAADGVEIEMFPKGEQPGKTGADGMVTLPLPDSGDDSAMLVARRGDDVALLPSQNSWWRGHTWYKNSQSDQMRWFVFDDRGMYKPGETVTVKGWMRKFEPRPTGDIGGVSVDKIEWILTGPQGNELAKGETDVTALGGFHLSVELPKTVNLGHASLRLEAIGAGLSNSRHHHAIQIQEFRRPEFEVSVTVQPGPHLLGDHVHASVNASYYAGGGLPNADSTWNASATPTNYTPPNRSDYHFGAWSPWWGGWWWQPPTSHSPPAHHAGKTDARGTHDVDVHFESLRPPRPMNVSLQATVMDVNRQAWGGSSSILVHPASLYVGLKLDKSFVDKGDPVDVDVIVSDIEGEIVGSRDVELRMARMEWGRDDKGQWGMHEKDAVPCDIRSAQDAKPCSFPTKRGGEYQITARVVDDEGRPNETTLRVWVSGTDTPPSRSIGQDQITLVPDAKEYADGQTARIYVQAPFAPAEGVMSWRRSGMLHHERFTMEHATTVLEVPITDAHTPNLHVQVDLVGSKGRTGDDGKPLEGVAPQPAYASGSLNLPVPPVKRTLNVEVVPRQDAVAPGAKTEIDLAITDADGNPVQGGEVVVAVVDEAVLALSGYTLANPVDMFYAQRGADVADYHLRSQVILAQADLVNAAAIGDELDKLGYIGGEGTEGFAVGGAASGYGGLAEAEEAPRERRASGARAKPAAAPSPAPRPVRKAEAKKRNGGDRKNQQAIALRTDFSALALFEPALESDAEGKLTVPVELPDSLTRYRIMVVAADGGKNFGKGESGLTARNPVMVRPSAPRFLNFGDRAELPVVVQNQTNEPITVDVAMRATNALLIGELPDDPLTVSVPGVSQGGLRVQVKANDRAEIRFPVAADMAGTARFQLALAAGDFADATELSIPVWTPATTEAFATYGEIDDGHIVQPVTAPPDVWTQFGGLEITTSSTALQALTDAVIYLSDYPFSCNEQLSSRVLAIAALRDVLDAFDAEGLPDKPALEAQVQRDLDQLAGRQDWNGGWGFWRKGDPTWPYLSIHIAHALARAEAKGFTLDANMRYRSLNHLRNIESHIPSWYHIRYRRMLIAYSLYVRELLGDHDGAKARKLYADAGLEGLSLEAQGWLVHVLHADGATRQVAEIRQHWGQRVSETAAAANFVTSYDDDAAHVILHSDRRVDGILLEALTVIDRDSDLIPKVVRGLMAHRKRGRWSNTQENAFVLVAMDRYFHEFEGQTPDFVARAWLGNGYAGDHTFEGRTTERARIDVPMGYLTETKGPQDLVLQKDGTGRMYYRIGMRYAPRDLRLDPAEHGFTVQRTYEPVDDDGDVTLEDGIWRIKAGSRVRVRVTMVATNRRYHVALVDPLPAGLEVMNPALKVTGALPQQDPKSQGRYWWWTRTWYEHENLRDERVEAFTSLLWDGVHEYTYVARATTPGQYVVPPPKAEEMYHPETFGRGSTARVVVY